MASISTTIGSGGDCLVASWRRLALRLMEARRFSKACSFFLGTFQEKGRIVDRLSAQDVDRDFSAPGIVEYDR